MQNDWIKTQAARDIVGRFDERRPAWLWSSDGQELIWQNRAARLFLAKQKKCRIKLAKEAVPIKGQVRRLLRLGSIGLSSLARVQFLAGGKPVSATCSCMPVVLGNDQAGLLIVGVDPVDAAIFADADLPDIAAKDSEEGGEEDSGADEEEASGAAEEGKAEQSFASAKDDLTRKSGPETGSEELGQLSALMDRLVNNSQLFEPLRAGDEIIPDELKWTASGEAKTGAGTFTPQPQNHDEPTDSAAAGATNDAAGDVHGGSPERAEIATPPGKNPGEQKPLWRVQGAGFTSVEGFAENSTASTRKTPSPPSGKTEEADRVARYNFDALSRILKEKVGSEPPIIAQKSASSERSQDKSPRSSAPSGAAAEKAVSGFPRRQSGRQEKRPNKNPQPGFGSSKTKEVQAQKDNIAGTGQTLNLSEEMLVLNRLPIGILIFRDQQILFANRAFASLMGSSSIERLHEGGLDGVFPRVGNADTPIGPVVSLVKLDGREVLVDARLQTITWQGAPALMLSASEQNTATDGEACVKAFTRNLARNNNHGYFETSHAGIINFISRQGAMLLGQSVKDLTASAISLLVDGADRLRFQEFLRQKARFAGATRPHTRLDCARQNLEIEIFTEGRAGIITGYFGIIRPKDTQQQSQKSALKQTNDSPLLARLSRGIRRPLNTILGFSELIYSEAFGALGNPRYSEYARDIKSAGNEIAFLVDEMDEYSRLKSAEFVPDSADFDLVKLLDECLRLVRSAANKKRVFVRSAISETLPAICADRASMRQAILNLLASAIDLTPAGGKVILSAQIEDDGSIGVHVRDSAKNHNPTSERFVVFREGNAQRGEALVPMKSSMGLALTRSLLAVNACALHVDPSVGTGTLMSLTIPAELFGRQS